MTDSYENLRNHLSDLSLKTIATIFEKEAEKAAKTGLSYTDYLKKLIEEEVANKTDRSINAKIAKAKFPQLKTLEMFEFSFQPSVDEKYIRELAHLGFMEKAENIVFLGPPGVGNYRKILLMERNKNIYTL
jgi:DNA replication protein DnaC